MACSDRAQVARPIALGVWCLLILTGEVLVLHVDLNIDQRPGRGGISARVPLLQTSAALWERSSTLFCKDQMLVWRMPIANMTYCCCTIWLMA